MKSILRVGARRQQLGRARQGLNKGGYDRNGNRIGVPTITGSPHAYCRGRAPSHISKSSLRKKRDVISWSAQRSGPQPINLRVKIKVSASHYVRLEAVRRKGRRRRSCNLKCRTGVRGCIKNKDVVRS